MRKKGADRSRRPLDCSYLCNASVEQEGWGCRGIPWMRIHSRPPGLGPLRAQCRDGGEPDHGLICRRLIYDPSEWQIEEDEAISRMKTEELDRLVAAGKIRAIDRERVRFIVRTIVHPPERPDDPLVEKAA